MSSGARTPSISLAQESGSIWEGCAMVVVAYGGLSRANAVLEQLAALSAGPRSIVVENPDRPRAPNPRDVTLPGGAQLISLERNLGYSAAANLGVRRARRDGADIVAILTHDAELEGDALRLLVGRLHDDPSLGAVGPVLYERGSDTPFSLGGGLAQDGPFHHHRHPDRTRIEWLDGAALVVRAEAFDQVGGFDERFFLYGEDLDLGLRLRAAGWTLEIVDDAHARHQVGARERRDAYRYLLHRNVLETFRKNRGLGTAVSYQLRSIPRLRSPKNRRPELEAAVHFATRRFGPPPGALAGDIRNHGARRRNDGARRKDPRPSLLRRTRRAAVTSGRTWLFGLARTERQVDLMARLTRVDEETISGRRLEIGSGRRPRPGFLHVDPSPTARFVHLRTSGQALPLPDSWAREVLSVHMLEHVPAQALVDTLTEWHRVLAPGGTLEIHVPNGTALARRFAADPPIEEQWPIVNVLLGCWGGPEANTPGAFTEVADHKVMFSFRLLRSVLEQAGFVDVTDVTGQVECFHAEAWADLLPEMCLEVRATRPALPTSRSR